MNLKKYDIVSINLNPKKWHTQAGVRPCVIIQNNIFNQYSPTIIVVPLTSNDKKTFPSEFIIKKSKNNWLTQDSRFLWSQIITVDKKFVLEKFWSLEDKYYEDLKNALSISLDLYDDF